MISPLLANIVLHEAMDTMVHQWGREQATGEIYIVRYADVAALAFEHEADAHALRAALEASLARYGLRINEAKTRLVPFGRHAGRTDTSQTFDFLGFTHYAGASLVGAYVVQRKTSRKRLRRRLQEVREWCRARCHDPVIAQWQMLSRKLKVPLFSSKARVLRHTRQRAGAAQLSPTDVVHLVARASVPEPDCQGQPSRTPAQMGAFRFPLRASPIRTTGCQARRVTCLEAPDAATPHVRFCEGERQQYLSYSTPVWCVAWSRIAATPSPIDRPAQRCAASRFLLSEQSWGQVLILDQFPGISVCAFHISPTTH